MGKFVVITPPNTAYLAGTGLTLITQPCNRLFENCSLDGCCDNTAGQRVCDCQPNWTFYVLLCAAFFGLAIGCKYCPATTSSAEMESEGKFYGAKWIGMAGHVMWLAFIAYSVFRTTSFSASDQLDEKTCKPR